MWIIILILPRFAPSTSFLTVEACSIRIPCPFRQEIVMSTARLGNLLLGGTDASDDGPRSEQTEEKRNGNAIRCDPVGPPAGRDRGGVCRLRRLPRPRP